MTLHYTELNDLLPVCVVKQNFLYDGEDGQLSQGPVEGGQLGAKHVSSPGHQVVNRHHHGPRDKHLVEQDAPQRLTKLHRIHLQDKGAVRTGHA